MSRTLKVVSIINCQKDPFVHDLLVVGRKNTKSQKFEFPGGKVKSEEGIEEAGLRELKEETNISPILYQFLTFLEYGEKLIWVYKGVSQNPPKVVEPENHLDWFRASRLDLDKLILEKNFTKEALAVIRAVHTNTSQRLTTF